MTRELIIFLITVIHLTYGLHSDTHHQSKYPRYEFILHKCTASAELNRKQQNKETLNINSNKPTENLLHKAYISFTMQEKNSTSQLHSPIVPVNSKVNSKHSLNNSETNYSNSYMEQFLTRDMENTPLRTLNIKAMRSILPIFTKKDLLPELENVSIETKNLSRSIIVIKSTI